MVNITDILGKIGFDWQVALANFINFLIVLFILHRFAFKPIKKIIETRQEKISQGLENAKKAEGDLMMAQEKKNEILSGAQEEVKGILIQAINEKTDLLAKAEDRAKKQAAQIIMEGQKLQQQEREKMGAQFREEGINLIISSAGKLLRENMNQEKNKKYIEKIVEDFA